MYIVEVTKMDSAIKSKTTEYDTNGRPVVKSEYENDTPYVVYRQIFHKIEMKRFVKDLNEAYYVVAESEPEEGER